MRGLRESVDDVKQVVKTETERIKSKLIDEHTEDPQ
jgi:hypothetical protein